MMSLLNGINTFEIYNMESKTTQTIRNITAKMTDGEKIVIFHGYQRTTEILINSINKLRKFDSNRAMEIWTVN
jgi:hypothetical protein